MSELIKDKKEINKIIEEKIKGRKFVFTKYYRIGSAEKGVSDEKVREILSKFDKVVIIEKEILKYGDVGYELFYELGENDYFSIALCPKNGNVLVIHAIPYRRNLRYRFKQG